MTRIIVWVMITCVSMLSAADSNLQKLTQSKRMELFEKTFDAKHVKVAEVKEHYKYFAFDKLKKEKASSFKRIDMLEKISKIDMNKKEKHRYKKLLDENIDNFSPISDVSLVSNVSCQHKLVYLGAEETKKGLLVIEKRMVNAKFKTYIKYLKKREIETYSCGKYGSGYLTYLNFFTEKKFYLKKKVEENLSIFYDAVKDVDDTDQTYYEVLKDMESLSMIKGERTTIPSGSRVVFEKIHRNNESFFYIGNVLYRATLKNWKNSTKKEKKEQHNE